MNENIKDFESSGLSAEILQGVEEAGFKDPSPIQQQAIPAILAGRDVIGQAQTGTGKTAAFGLPLMSRLLPAENIVILVVVPTRELAVQVSDELYALGKHARAKPISVYGGSSAHKQVEKFKRGANIIAGTPGRLLDLIGSGRIKPAPKAVVLDEADRMLDMGFMEDIERIFALLPRERQTLLFSATLPERIQKLAEKILKNPVRIKTESAETAARIKQKYFVVDESEREAALLRLIDAYDPDRAVVFCRTKRETDELASRLSARGIAGRAIHGDMEQNKREEVLRAFRKGTVHLLIATDVAARGLDVQGITHVFNYHIPFDMESYTHRIGRTGRAGLEGLAFTLVTPGEMRTWRRMNRETGGRSEFATVPDLADLKRKQTRRAQEKIEGAPVNARAEELVSKLEGTIGLREAALRMASLLTEESSDGPERIGKSPEEAGRLGRDDKKGGKGGKGPRKKFKERPGPKGRPENRKGKKKRKNPAR